MQHPDMPAGTAAYTLPQVGTVPKEYLPYMPGFTEGQTVDRKLLDEVGKTYRTEVEKKAIQDNTPGKENEDSWIAAAAQGDAIAKQKLAMKATQKAAERPVIQNFIPGLGSSSPTSNTKLSGDAYLATLPTGTAAQIRAIAEGRAPLPSASTRSQAAQDLRAAVFTYDPTYSDQRGQVRKAFTTGPDGRNIGSLNTASVHLDQLSEVAMALENGTFQPGNAVWNKAKTMFGNSTPTDFESVKAAVAGELATALKGQATDIEVATMSRNINAAQSPRQLAQEIDKNLHILGAKLNTYQERYQAVMPGDIVWSPILPSARDVYNRHGFDPTAGPGNPPNATPPSGASRIRILKVE